MPDDIADEVHLKRKVTIREKHEEPDNSGNPNDGGNENPPTTETPKGKKWFLWLIIIAIIMIGGYLWYSQNGKSGSEPIAADSTQVEKTDSAKTASTDSVVSTTSGSDNNGSKGSNGNSASTSQKNQEKMRSENRKALLLHPAMRPQCLLQMKSQASMLNLKHQLLRLKRRQEM